MPYKLKNIEETEAAKKKMLQQNRELMGRYGYVANLHIAGQPVSARLLQHSTLLDYINEDDMMQF